MPFKRKTKQDKRKYRAYKTKSNKQGDKKEYIPVKPNRTNATFCITKEEQDLAKNRKDLETSKTTRNSKNVQEQTAINWASFGGVEQKLRSTSFRPMYTKIKPKRYNRWSKK